MAPGSPQPESGPLIKRPSDGFQQQGQFDWFALAKSTVSWSVDVVARLSAAGVDPYTIIVAQNLGLLFKLSSQGRRLLHSALTNLVCLKSIDNALWFGIGARHVIRDLASTEQGTLYLGLCGSLTTCFSEDASAEILSELVSISKAPVELSPSVNDWKNLIHACNGVLHASQFPVHAEHLMNLHPTPMGSSSVGSYAGPNQSGIKRSSPESIAKALLAVGDVTRGATKAITIVGGPDAGFIAALSEWLFGLNVSVMGPDNTILYPSNNEEHDRQSLQVLVCFRATPATQYEAPSLDSERMSTELMCLEKVYHLEDATTVFVANPMFPQGDNDKFRVSGRVPWNSAFAKTFRKEFHDLIAMRAVVGRAIGSLARILLGISRNENGIRDDAWRSSSLPRWSLHNDTAHGRGFINNVVYWFPELEPIEDQMEDAVRLSYADAQSLYETQHALLSHACECNMCHQESVSERDSYCKVILLETIMQISQIMSVVVVDKSLMLKRCGIEAVYQQIFHAKGERQGAPTNYNALRVKHGAVAHAIYQADLMTLHAAVVELFSGERPPYLSQEPAHSQHGICTFLGVLREVSDSKNLAGQFHVVPGRIEYHSRPYDSVKDGHPSIMDKFSITGSVMASILDNTAQYEPYTARIRQAVDGLQLWFEATSPRQLKPVILEPCIFISHINSSRGFTHCPRRNCRVVCSEANDVKSGESRVIPLLDKTIRLIRQKTLARCIAMGGSASEYEVLLRGDECLQCCVRAALASPRSKIMIVSE